METFITILIILFAFLACIDTLINALGIGKSYPNIISILVFYISTTLGILYVTKLCWILFVLEILHSQNKDDWNTYYLYRWFDYVCCLSLFGYQMYKACNYLFTL